LQRIRRPNYGRKEEESVGTAQSPEVWRAFGIIAVLAIAVASLNWLKTFGAQPKVPFHIEEATISDIQSALLAKRITTVGVVNLYLQRIKANCLGVRASDEAPSRASRIWSALQSA